MKVLLAACAAAIVGSCFVDKVSDDFECDSQANCTDGRVCEEGFCVESDCSQDCNAGCDPIGRICAISCSSPGQCSDVTCPSGFDCTINCSGPNACGDVDCRDARSCTVSCSATNACGDIDCGTGDCNVNCLASNACDIIDCESSCACDVQCATGTCIDTQCPDGTLMMCTDDGTTATTCSSTAQAGCLNCP